VSALLPGASHRPKGLASKASTGAAFRAAGGWNAARRGVIPDFFIRQPIARIRCASSRSLRNVEFGLGVTTIPVATGPTQRGENHCGSRGIILRRVRPCHAVRHSVGGKSRRAAAAATALSARGRALGERSVVRIVCVRSRYCGGDAGRPRLVCRGTPLRRGCIGIRVASVALARACAACGGSVRAARPSDPVDREIHPRPLAPSVTARRRSWNEDFIVRRSQRSRRDALGGNEHRIGHVAPRRNSSWDDGHCRRRELCLERRCRGAISRRPLQRRQAAARRPSGASRGAASFRLDPAVPGDRCRSASRRLPRA